MSRIFVVTNDEADLTVMLGVLARAGYSVAGATTFEEAQRLLATQSPEIVIADERLGAFNGLHVLITARADHPYADLIVTTPKRNRFLEQDARSLNVHCIVKPRNVDEWVATIDELLEPAVCVA